MAQGQAMTSTLTAESSDTAVVSLVNFSSANAVKNGSIELKFGTVGSATILVTPKDGTNYSYDSNPVTLDVVVGKKTATVSFSS